MKNLLLLLITLTCIFFTGCENKSRYSHLLEEAERLISTNPDSSYYLLSEILDPGVLSPKDKADYGFLLSSAHYKQGKAMAEDSLILFALDYYKNREDKNKDKLPMSYFLAANYYQWNEETSDYRKMLNEGIDFSIANKDSLMVYLMYRRLAGVEMESKNYLEAVDFSHEALKYRPNNKSGVFYNIGIIYSRINQNDSADHYFKESLKLHILEGDDDINFVRRNYADFLSGIGKNMESLQLHYENMELGYVANFSMAKNYLALGQLDSAQFYLDRQKQLELDITNTNILMAAQAVINYTNNKDIDWGSFGRFNDSLIFRNYDNRKLLEEKIEMKSQLERKNFLLTIQSQRFQLYTSWALFTIVFIGFISLLYISRKRRLLIETEEKREALEKLLQEVSETHDKRNKFSKKILLQQLGLIRIVATTPTVPNQQLLKQISLIDNKEVNPDQMLVWDDFYKMIDLLYDNFYSCLISKYGIVLTDKEVQLACLLRAGFSTKEIGVLTGQKSQTIYQRKTGIRQKLKMGEKEDIVEFVSV